MPIYPNPAGGSMEVADQADAIAKGWTPSMGTFGINSDPNAGGGGIGQSAGMASNGGLGQLTPEEQAQVNATKAASGFSYADLNERKRQFDAQLEWQKQMWANQGMPELQIRQQAQALAQQEFEAQNALAQKNFELAQELGRGNLAVSQGQLALGQSNLGLDYLKTAASLGGPADYFQQANFLRGASSNAQLPAFLQALQNNTGLAAFNAPGGVAPGAQSMQGLVGGLTGGQAPINQQQALNAIGGIGAAGGQALSPQALESLTPDELNLLQSGLRASGFSMPSFLQSYTQSRIGQGAASNY